MAVVANYFHVHLQDPSLSRGYFHKCREYVRGQLALIFVVREWGKQKCVHKES